MDRWPAGWDKGRRGNRGMSYKLRGVTRARIHNADKKHTTWGGDHLRAEGKRREDDSVSVRSGAPRAFWLWSDFMPP